MSTEPMHPVKPILFIVAIVTFLVYAVGAPIVVYQVNRDAIERNQQTLHVMCAVLTDVIHTSYTDPPAIDPKKLPARTQQLLADLKPLIDAQSVDGEREAEVLAKLRQIPGC